MHDFIYLRLRKYCSQVKITFMLNQVVKHVLNVSNQNMANGWIIIHIRQLRQQVVFKVYTFSPQLLLRLGNFGSMYKMSNFNLVIFNL